MAEELDVDTLKRRGRRRLIGAIALVLLAVIVLPMVFDPEPKTNTPPVQIRIPGEGESGFNPKGNTQAAAPAADPAREPLVSVPERAETAPAAGKIAPGTVPAKNAAKAQTEKSAPAAQPAPAAASAKPAGYIVPVAAFSSSDKVKELASTLRSAKLPYYTEPVATAKGPVTRVRAGPFASREAAERAREKLQGLGLKPGNAVPREG